MPTIKKKDIKQLSTIVMIIGASMVGAGLLYFALKPKKKRQITLIPPMATNEFTYPMSPDEYRAMKTNEDYSDFERYISWDVANIHPSYKEYLKYWYGLF